MKKIFVYLLVMTVLFTFSTTIMGEEVKKVDLKSALHTALEQNLELKSEKLNLEKAKLQYKKNKANNLLNNSQYNELEAEHNLTRARNTYQNVYAQLVNDTIQQYTNLLLAEVGLTVKEKQVKLEKLLLDEARAQYEIGDIGNVELLEQENTYKDEEFNLETAQDDYYQSMKEFKTLLGIDDTKIILSELEKPQIWQVKEEEAVNTALENSLELQLNKEEIELAEIDLKRAKVSASSLDKEIKEIALTTSRVKKKNTEEEIINSVQAAYYQFKKSVKEMNLKKERLNEAREKYKLRQEQYDSGLLTKSDLLQYEINMMEADYQYRSALAGYYLQEQSLRKTMNLETGVFADELEGE